MLCTIYRDNYAKMQNRNNIKIEELIRRDVINISEWLEAGRCIYSGKRILVTGAGGSIGRELCRQLSLLAPSSIILLDKDENAIFEAERELRASLAILSNGRRINIIPVICDLRITEVLHRVFLKYKPEIVFHAASHKHVPLLEINISEAVLNNVGGAKKLLECTQLFNVERCVMVSTDKAVNPTSIMGATKRVAELMFQSQADAMSNINACYSCVRFGNVLDSRGSVVQIFRDQILNGGPVTVTHPDVERYFMTIPEAAQLIIQAGAMGTRGEIFLLDMGEPIKILDLAMDMIRMSGLTPNKDVSIEYIGLRSGEKLKEQLLIAEEGSETTGFDKIFTAPPLAYNFEMLDDVVSRLIKAASIGDETMICDLFLSMGIGYTTDKLIEAATG